MQVLRLAVVRLRWYGWLVVVVFLVVLAGAALLILPPFLNPADPIEPLSQTPYRHDPAIEIDALELSEEGAFLDSPDEPTPLDSPRRSAPLPQDMVVVDLITQLDESARNGDPEAVCRLTAELLRCRGNAMTVPPDPERWAESLATQELSDEDLAKRTDMMVQAMERSERLARVCEGVSVEQIRAVPRYFLAAGTRGHVPSMISFANASGIGGADIVADSELYALYRAHAGRLFLAAIESGHPAAVSVWQGALRSQGFQFLGGALPEGYRDRGVADALSRRLDSIAWPDADPGAIGRAALDPDDVAQADALFDAHFRHSAWPAAYAELFNRTPSLSDAPVDLSPCLLDPGH